MQRLRLAWKFAAFHRTRTLLLVLCLALGMTIPFAMQWLSADVEQAMGSRARSTPFIVGPRGSRLELAISGLYLRKSNLPDIQSGDQQALEKDELAEIIPLHLGHSALKATVVGTNFGYFSHRDLTLAQGNWPRRLGDCVLGSQFARTHNFTVGDSVMTDTVSYLNPAGQLPLKMRITGILNSSSAADDAAVFTDIKTSWVIDGLGHGHKDADKLHENQTLQQEGSNRTLNANVETYLEITEDNQTSFHFHGDQSSFPVSVFLAYPADSDRALIWEGRVTSRNDLQLIRPELVIQELLEVMLNVRRIINAILGMICIIVAVLLGLLIMLSVQLRQKEMKTYRAIGSGSMIRIQLLGYDFLIVLGLAIPLACLLAWTIYLIGRPILLEYLTSG